MHCERRLALFLTDKTPAKKGNKGTRDEKEDREEDRPFIPPPAKDDERPESCHGVNADDED